MSTRSNSSSSNSLKTTNDEHHSPQSKIKDILSCFLCFNRYNSSEHQPLILPCGKTLCKKCVLKYTDENENVFKCYFCGNRDHRVLNSKKLGDFPINDTLNELVRDLERRQAECEKETRVNILKMQNTEYQQNPKYRKLLTLLNQVEENSNKLDSSIKNSRNKILTQINHVEKEIDERADFLINEIRECKASLMKDLNVHKKRVLISLDDQLHPKNSSIILFHKESRLNYQKLLQTSVNMKKYIDESELKSIYHLSDDLNERILKTRLLLDKITKNNITLHKPSNDSLKFEPESLIGRLELSVKQPSQSNIQTDRIRSVSTMNLANRSNFLNRSKTISFKVPYNCKNLMLGVLSDKKIVKVSEMALINDYSYTLNINIMDSSSSNKNSHKLTEEIGSYRLKKVQSNFHNNSILIFLMNKFVNSLNKLVLYNSQLEVVKSISVDYRPLEIFMNKNGIYVLTSQLRSSSSRSNSNIVLYKYDHDLKLLDTYNFAFVRKRDHSTNNHNCINGDGSISPSLNNDSEDCFYIDRNLNLIGIENEKLYFIDMEKLRLRIINELDGKMFKSFKIEEEELSDRKENLIVRVDSMQRVNVLNKKTLKMSVYSSMDAANGSGAGLLVSQRVIDSKIQSLDYFYTFSDSTYCFIDRKNNLIHFV
jgi:hypothetical protein